MASSGTDFGERQTPTGLQTENWRLLWAELQRDTPAVARLTATVRQRERVRVEMISLLARYSAGDISTEELRATLDHRARRDWSCFALRGPSGTMFLGTLVRHIPEPALAPRLRTALVPPRDATDGRRRLRALFVFLEGLVRTGTVPRRAMQPARVVFLATLCWHLQQPDEWPAFQLSARSVFRREPGLYAPTGDYVDDYFAFRTAFLALARALPLSPAELEYLCWWQDRPSEERSPEEEAAKLRRPRPRGEPRSYRARYADRSMPMSVVREPEACRADDETVPYRSIGDHTHLQWLLATLGRQLGYRVWIAANDWGKAHEGETLGSLSEPSLPSLGISAEARRLVSLIDVLWLRGEGEVAAAFEVEQTTSVHSGLLRMADLASLSPNLSFPLYVVVPRDRLDKVRRELSRPTLRALGLHRRSAYFSAEALEDAAADILRWGRDISAIDRLAFRLDDPSSASAGPPG